MFNCFVGSMNKHRANGTGLAVGKVNWNPSMSTLTLHRSPLKRIAISVVLTLIIGLLSGLAMMDSLDTWYAGLQRPWFAPPNWLFGPVWTALYILMGIAAGMVWNEFPANPHARLALWLFVAQLLLNAAWSFIFFSLHRMVFALVEMGVLWVLIILCMFAMARVRKASAWLMVPYISWVSFAYILNAAYVNLN